MKDTNEFVGFGAKGLKVGKEITADGKFNGEDLAKALPLIFSGQAAFEGLNNIGPEQAGIGPTEKGVIRQNVEGELSNFSPVSANDWTDVIMGLLSVYRLGYRSGKEEAEQAILKELDAKGAKAVLSRLKSA